VRLAEQWSELLDALPRDWETLRVELALAEPADAEPAESLLGVAATGGVLTLDVERDARTVRLSPQVVARALARLDADGVSAELRNPVTFEGRHALAEEWRALTTALPPDWSHLLAEVELDSSDFVDRSALLMAPANPTLVDGVRCLRFRAARQVGYGISAGMAARCLERLDGESITGRVSIVHIVSEAKPVATQGPVWRLGGKPV
jgi:hypothetical protein